MRHRFVSVELGGAGEQILAEVREEPAQYPQTRRGKLTTIHNVTPEKAVQRIEVMRSHFPDAMVTGYKSLIKQMECDQKDRHVLAAAVRANAEVIVTTNLKDFPQPALEPYDINVAHPDDFLLDQLDLNPRETMVCLEKLVAARRRPTETLEIFLPQLRKTVPKFSDEALRLLAGG